MHPTTARLSALGLTAAAALALAGCHTGGSASSTASSLAPSARASASALHSALVNSPQYKKDKAALISRINSCWHQHAASFHPYQGTMHCVFPKGDIAAIEGYAKRTFTLTVISSATTRHAWEQGVAVYALNHGRK